MMKAASCMQAIATHIPATTRRVLIVLQVDRLHRCTVLILFDALTPLLATVRGL
jgi:hypothetical protein